MTVSRRDFLRGAGALIVSFSAAPLTSLAAPEAQNEFGTHSGHIDPDQLDSWLALSANGTVTACTGKCDFGQGMLTAQTQLVAEELCVPLARVRLIQCDTALTPDQGTTSGSQSTPTNFNDENLALAAATAREALLTLAATLLKVDPSTLTVADGVIASSSGHKLTYSDLLTGQHFDLPLNKTAKRRTPAQWTVLGKPVPSLDHPELMTGHFEYVQYVKLPGMLHGRVVRPPAMGATVFSVDEASVGNLPGNVRVVRRKDFIGVVADTQYAATVAARTLAVRWNPGPPLPPQATIFDHLQQQSGHDETSVDSGDLDAAFTGKNVLRARYTYPYQMHGSVGTSCAVAEVKRDAATVWSSTQSVYPTRSCIAQILNLQPEQVRVIYTRGSGCYGLNGADAVSFDAAVLSQAVGHPVRLQYTRQDENLSENLGAAVVVEHRAALTPEGQIAAWDRENWVASLGNRPGYDRPGNVITGMLLGYPPEELQKTNAKQPEAQSGGKSGAEAGTQSQKGKFHNQSNTVPNYLAGCVDGECGGQGTIHAERVVTHTVPSPFFTGPLRSPLRIQNTFANECFMNELAREAHADPVAFRLQHLHDPRLIAVLKAATDKAGWQPRPSAPVAATSGILTGRGIACVAYEGQNGYAALVAEIKLDAATGLVRPTRFVVAIDCGPVSNPDGLRNQIEGGLLQGSSRALVEQATWDETRLTSTDWEGYPSLRLDLELPVIDTVIVSPPGVRATGAGETAITVTPAALGNAIFDAAGIRLREVPFTPERVKAALQSRPQPKVAHA